MKTINPATKKPSGRPELLKAPPKWFGAAMLAIPFVFFLMLEAGLRLADYRGNLDLFLPIKWQDNAFLQINPAFSKRYFFSLEAPPTPSNDLILAEKPANGLRIFYLGESSAAGYPYGHNGMPSRVIADVLQDQFPDRTVEVINMAMSAINSYTLYDMTDEILAQKPDAIFIYTGHNEYYGALGIGSNESLGAFPPFVRFYLKIQRLKTFLLVRDVLLKLSVFVSNKKIDQSKTLMERVVREQVIEKGSPVFEMGIKQFNSNMGALLKKYRNSGVPVYISTVASNERDFPPFVSVGNDSLTNASTAFQTARRYLATGDSVSAVRFFRFAKELDVLRFRAPEAINDEIRRFADGSAIFPVDAKKALEAKTPLGVTGNEWFLEHLHPNWHGNFEIAKTFSKTFLETGPFKKEGFNPLNTDWNSYKSGMLITEFDEQNCFHRLQVLYSGWPFRKQSIKRDAYLKNYKVRSVADSIAIQTVHGNLLWADAKLELAKIYTGRGLLFEAGREYEGLYRDDPSNITLLEACSQRYIDSGQFQDAHRTLKKLVRLKPEYDNAKFLGIVSLQLGKTEDAIVYLEKAGKMRAADPQLLYNLSGAYGLKKDFKTAQLLLDSLKLSTPGFPGVSEWQTELDRHLKRN